MPKSAKKAGADAVAVSSTVPGSLVEDLQIDPDDTEAVAAASSAKKAPAKATNGSSAPTSKGSSSKKKKKTPKGKKSPTPQQQQDEQQQKQDTPSSSASKENKKKSPSGRPSIGKTLNKTYGELIHEAIVALKDRTGSSQPAISKWILCHYPHAVEDNPHYRRNLNAALKTGVQKERFTKTKASYKISAAYKAKEKAKKKRAAAAAKKKQDDLKRKKAAAAAASKTAAATAPLTTAQKLVQTQQTNAKRLAELEQKEGVSEADIIKLKAELAKKEQAIRRKAEAEQKAKERAERLKKRRFPMEDTKLHAEDKELNVKPPADVLPRPYLPYFWHAPVPFGHKSRSGKTHNSILQASKVDGLDGGSHGLVPDLLQIYHFFRGDVHFTSPNDNEYHTVVPEFTLKHLMFAVEQVMNGNAKKSRMVPPLLVHLFVTCLQILFLPAEQDAKWQREVRQCLGPTLSPASWSEVCFLYMDAMQRHYSSDASRDPAVLPSLAIDMEYLMGMTEQAQVPMTPAAPKKQHNDDDDDDDGEEGQTPLPERYYGYLGDPSGALFRAQDKLMRQDPWMLTAEELVALLRALTDDILASNPAISQDIEAREEEMKELLRSKRAADAKFRKVRLAFEGPKQKPRRAAASAATTTDNKSTDAKSTDGDNGKANGGAKPAAPKAEEPFKPTATKKQFESATRAQQRANDAYEKGIRKLVARTEPIGYDRNFNAVYCFRHDPEILYVEEVRPAGTGTTTAGPVDMQFQRRSWHVIEQTSLFDNFASSLDIRGKRENELYEELLGPQGAKQSLRRFLHDDIKEQADANAKLKEKEALKKRLEIARMKCDEEQGRRSGRLAGQAEIELSQIEFEIQELEQEAKGKTQVPVERDFAELTGLEALRRFDKMGQQDKRRSREVKVNKSRYVELMRCSNLCATGNIDGTGIIGMVVTSLLQLEELCESLAPWERAQPDRSTWIANLENAVACWGAMNPDLLGPADTPRKPSSAAAAEVGSPAADVRRDSMGSVGSAAKRRKVDSSPAAGAQSVHGIITLLKTPLLQLEARAADITNLALAARDQQIADDNMSTDGTDDDQAEQERLDRAWKRLVHKIRETPTKRYVQIRELLTEAITAARKTHHPELVAQLRAAILLHRPAAAGECKAAAVKVLVEHGDYDEEDDEEEEEEEEAKEEPVDEGASALCMEAAFLESCLEDTEDASRADWIAAVKSVKTIARLAALVNAFCHKAKKKLQKIEQERDALTSAIAMWEKQEERKAKSNRGGRAVQDYEGPTEVWANCSFTTKTERRPQFCMVHCEKYPWWPAKKCYAKDPAISQSLEGLNRSLVALVGEMGSLRVVKNEDIRPFEGTEVPEEEETADPKDYSRAELNVCVAMARRIQRGIQRGTR